MKLVVSYLIYPALSLSFLFLFGPNLSSLPSPLVSVLVREALVKSLIYLYVFFLLLPSIVRFVVKREGVRYGLEAFLYTAASIGGALFLSYAVEGILLFPGILDLIAVHNILTYRTQGGNTTSTNARNAASLVSFLVLAGWGYVVFGNGFPFSSKGLALWGPLLAVNYILNVRKDVFEGAGEADRSKTPPAELIRRAQSPDAPPLGKAVVYPWEEGYGESSRNE